MSDDVIFNYIINNLDKNLNWNVIIKDTRLIYKIYKHIDELWNCGYFQINQELAWIIKNNVSNPDTINFNIKIIDNSEKVIIDDFEKIIIN
jgi:hypothetical protein